MDNLPQELVDKISYKLSYDDLKRTLFVSRKFQCAAERASGAFAFFAFKAHSPRERQGFLSKFGGHRFRYLRQITVFIDLPPLVSEERSLFSTRHQRGRGSSPIDQLCRESAEDLYKKDETFTEKISGVWQTVHTAEAMQENRTGRMQIRILTPTQLVDDTFCDHRRYSSWRVHLLNPQDLPKLHSVRALCICNPAYEDMEDGAINCKIDLRVVPDLASRCPNLEYLGCKLGVDEWADSADPWMEHFMHDYPGCRRDARNDFASAIQDMELPSLQHVQLDFINEIHQSVEEQRRPMPNLVSPSSFDPFSSSLRLLSYRLRKLELHVMADDTLFWPREDITQPSWPNLEILSVMFHMCSPSGTWYFQSPLEVGRDDKGYDFDTKNTYPPLRDQEDDAQWCHEKMDGTPNALPTFRVAPIEDSLRPFLAAFSTAAINMPKLLEAWLWTPLTYHPYNMPEESDKEVSSRYPKGESGWGIMYSAPGTPVSDTEGSTTIRTLKWRVGPWRPDPDLRRMFSRIGEDKYGSRLEESWYDDGKENTLMSREWFWGGTICPDHADRSLYPTYF